MYRVEVGHESDGRWIAEVPELPGVLAHGGSRDEAVRKAQVLSLRVLAERLDHGEPLPEVESVFSIVARTGRTPDEPPSIHDAAFDGDFATVNRLLDEDPGLAHALSDDGDTPLHLACWGKQPRIVGLLLAHEPDVNARASSNGRTPLHYAVHEGGMLSAPIVQALLMHGADPGIKDNFGLTPAEWAKVEMTDGLPEVLSFLQPSRRRPT